MRRKSLIGLVVAALVFTFTFALAAGAEETTDASAAATKDEGSEQPLRFAEGERTSQADARAVTRVSGPLVGTRVGTLTTDGDAFIDLITIPRPDCTAGEGASFVLQDEDGTQADFIEGTNVQIDGGDPGLRVVGLGAQNANISPLNIRGGDGILDSGGLVIVTSTDIECTDDNPPPPDNPPPDNPSPDDNPPADYQQRRRQRQHGQRRRHVLQKRRDSRHDLREAAARYGRRAAVRRHRLRSHPRGSGS